MAISIAGPACKELTRFEPNTLGVSSAAARRLIAGRPRAALLSRVCQARPFGSNPMNPLQTGPAIEIAIEAEDRSDAMALHDCDVDGIAG